MERNYTVSDVSIPDESELVSFLKKLEEIQKK